MKKKTKKAAKPRPKTVTILAWSNKSMVVHEVRGSELDIEIVRGMGVRR